MNLLKELDNNIYIQNINEKYDIRLCLQSDIVVLKEFLQHHWKKDHILTKHDELLNWQFYNKNKKCYNIILAINKQTEEINGVLFFIPSDHYDENNSNGGVWISIFKVLSSIKKQGLGTSLYRYLNQIIEIKDISLIGISDEAINIYRDRWDFHTGICSHFYMINNTIKNPIIAINPTISSSNSTINSTSFSNITIDEYKQLNDSFFKYNSIYKSKIFYINRYYNAPIYKYKFIAIKNRNSDIDGILIIRVCQSLNVNIIRIVDYIGDIKVLINNYDNFQQLLYSEKAEYIDFICAGFDEDILKKSGFILKESGQTVIPNFFEPFEHKNIEIKYANKTSFHNKDIVFVKGDSDQDRPNII